MIDLDISMKGALVIGLFAFISQDVVALDFSCPLPKCDNISAEFDLQRPLNPHRGIDFAVPEGTSVSAPADGIVVDIGSTKVAGQYIVLKHAEGFLTRFLHLQQVIVPEGGIVTLHQPIAKTGSTGVVTGPVLHFEILKDGVPQAPSYWLDLPDKAVTSDK